MPANPRALIDRLLRGCALALLATSLAGCESWRDAERARPVVEDERPLPAVAAPATGRPTPLLTPRRTSRSRSSA